MSKCPYTWPHRTRKAMLAYLSEHVGYHPMSTWNGGFVLAWNVKVYSVDETGKSAPVDFPTCDRFDARWKEEAPETLFNDACESAGRTYADAEWTNYPGIEQGEWQFAFNGRSGGWLMLTEAPAWLPAPRRWKLFSMAWESRADYQEWLAELDTATLRRVYRAVRVLDHDLRREACEQEVSYHIAAARHQWEQELLQHETEEARDMERSRPDLYCETPAKP